MNNLTIYKNFVSKAKSNQGSYFRENLRTENFLILASSNKIQTNYFKNNDGAYSFKYNFTGKEFYDFSNKHLATMSDRFLLTNPDSRYSSYIDEEKKVNTLYLFFSTKEIQSLYHSLITNEEKLLDTPNGGIAELHFYEKLYELTPEINLLLKEIVKNTLDVDAFCKIEHQIYLLKQNLIISQHDVIEKQQNIKSTKVSTKQEVFKRIQIAKDYIDSYFDKPLSNKELANIACMCEHHFLRRFKSIFNVTPYQYLSNRRIEQAKILLVKEHNSIGEISLSLGFDNFTSFNRSFKKNVGCSPTDFKSNNNYKSFNLAV